MQPGEQVRPRCRQLEIHYHGTSPDEPGNAFNQFVQALTGQR
jgi:hypothetical protein